MTSNNGNGRPDPSALFEHGLKFIGEAIKGLGREVKDEVRETFTPPRREKLPDDPPRQHVLPDPIERCADALERIADALDTMLDDRGTSPDENAV